MIVVVVAAWRATGLPARIRCWGWGRWNPPPAPAPSFPPIAVMILATTHPEKAKSKAKQGKARHVEQCPKE